MKVMSLTSPPEGLRAVYVAVTAAENEQGYVSSILDRLVDCVALLDLEAADIRAEGPEGRQGAQRGRKTEMVGVIFEGTMRVQFAPDATEWLSRIYGERLIGARMLGYTRGDSIDDIMEAVQAGSQSSEIEETRRYWATAANEAVQRIVNA